MLIPITSPLGVLVLAKSTGIYTALGVRWGMIQECKQASLRDPGYTPPRLPQAATTLPVILNPSNHALYMDSRSIDISGL
jgi:hypothetical protein